MGHCDRFSFFGEKMQSLDVHQMQVERQSGASSSVVEVLLSTVSDVW